MVTTCPKCGQGRMKVIGHADPNLPHDDIRYVCPDCDNTICLKCHRTKVRSADHTKPESEWDYVCEVCDATVPPNKPETERTAVVMTDWNAILERLRKEIDRHLGYYAARDSIESRERGEGGILLPAEALKVEPPKFYSLVRALAEAEQMQDKSYKFKDDGQLKCLYNSTKKQFDIADDQLCNLRDFVVDNFDDELGENELAVDCAIRLLSKAYFDKPAAPADESCEHHKCPDCGEDMLPMPYRDTWLQHQFWACQCGTLYRKEAK